MSFASLASDAVLISYGVVTASLALVGVYYGLIAVERVVTSWRAGTEETHTLPETHPSVTVQVPVYTERHVVDRVLALDEFLLDSDDLADVKRPPAYYFVDELPKNPSGKVQKFKLREEGVPSIAAES